MTYPYFASRVDWPWLVRPSGRSVIGQSVISLALNSRPRTQPRTMSSTMYETLTQSSNYAAYLSKAGTGIVRYGERSRRQHWQFSPLCLRS